ncbi:MAG: glycosyltransferase family 2 protein [Pseudomonadales bacterium]|nr:glycosyltransferase family 2 protein [Pseudomonadales bacterium]
MFKACIVIPVYNHGEAMAKTLSEIQAYDLPCFIVNDASDAHCSQMLGKFNKQYDWITLKVHDKNKGKGGAVKTGLIAAFEAGFSHAIQVDADGQHNLNDIPNFLTQSQNKPDSLIIGSPLYDDSVPKHREYARYLTHVWVWINTLSFDIKDSMCGYRVYPLKQTVTLIHSVYLGNRMDFDVEVLVKSHWAHTSITSLATKVLYPEDGISHFQPLRDNILITCMHTRLFFGMLKRLPQILLGKFNGR